jgi:MoaA/NifB/PqqE/SkfB family radical SAM enzyme
VGSIRNVGGDMSVHVIDWRITSDCNNKCKFCYASEQIKSMSKEKFFKVTDKIVDSGCKTVCISGGEPLLCNETISVIKRLYEKGLSVYLSTNGTNYIEQRAFIEPYITKLALPLDGFSKDSNLINGREGNNFKVVSDILELYRAQKHYFAIQVGTVLTQKNSNIEHFINMYYVLKNYTVDIWKIYEFIPEGRGIEYANELLVDYASFKQFMEHVKNINQGNRMNVIFLEREKRNAAYFIIRPDGKVMIPIENGVVEERIVGSMLDDEFELIVSRWSQLVNSKNFNDIWNKRVVKNA